MLKLVERAVAARLTSYLTAYGLMPQLQSAYRRHHSTVHFWRLTSEHGQLNAPD